MQKGVTYVAIFNNERFPNEVVRRGTENDVNLLGEVFKGNKFDVHQGEGYDNLTAKGMEMKLREGDT
jgi:Caspase domain